MSSHRDGRFIAPDSLERLRTTVIALFAAGTFRTVGMREIARQAGVGPATIYKYFGSKDELIFACIQPELLALGQQLRDATEQTRDLPTRQRFLAFGHAFVGFYLTHRQIGEVVYLTIPARNWIDNDAFVQTQQLALGAQILHEGQQRGEVRGDVPAPLLIELVAGATHRYLMRLLSTSEHHDPHEHAERLFRICWPMLQA